MVHNSVYDDAVCCRIVIAEDQTAHLLAPAVTVGETEGAMDSASVPVFISSFAYNFEKKARITIFGMWVTSRWIMDRLKYF